MSFNGIPAGNHGEPGEEWRQIARHPGYEVSDGGRVRSLTRIIRRKNGTSYQASGRIIRPARGGNGYPFVNLRGPEGKKTARHVHALVTETFLGPRPPRAQLVRHLNGIKSDNRLENLTYGTNSENQLDAIKHGVQFGLNQKSKTHCPAQHEYSPENTYVYPSGSRECRRCHNERRQQERLAARAAKRCLGTIEGCYIGIAVTEPQALTIRSRFAAGELLSRIARAFGLPRREVLKIVRGERWSTGLYDRI